MADDGEVVKPPPEPKLFKVLCCPANTKQGATIVNTLNTPYADNEEDRNTIVGNHFADFRLLDERIYRNASSKSSSKDH